MESQIIQIFRPIYIPLLSVAKGLRYFYWPNLFSKTVYSYENLPAFQQRTEIKGKGKIVIGRNCTFGYKPGGFHYGGSIELQARTEAAVISIGNNVTTNNNIFICSSNSISIGSDTLIGQNVTIMDFEAHGIPPDKRRAPGETGSVTIQDNVWIGNNVIILKNTVIGQNSIIAAGAVVSGDFPENVIIGGVPAKIIKQL